MLRVLKNKMNCRTRELGLQRNGFVIITGLTITLYSRGGQKNTD